MLKTRKKNLYNIITNKHNKIEHNITRCAHNIMKNEDGNVLIMVALPLTDES